MHAWWVWSHSGPGDPHESAVRFYFLHYLFWNVVLVPDLGQALRGLLVQTKRVAPPRRRKRRRRRIRD